jgi:hypothetical protein
MGWKDEFHASVVKWLNDKDSYTHITDAVEIVDIRQEERNGGYCETCYHEYDAVVIDYRDTTGLVKSYEWYGDMGEFMRYLTD